MISTVKGHFKTFTGSARRRERWAEVAELSIDASSINTNVEARDTHLKSPDFFDAAQFPTITFKSTKIEQEAPTSRSPAISRCTA